MVTDYLASFFGVVIKGGTDLNLLYIFLAFPWGLFYFLSLVSGLVAGLAMLIVWISVLMLLDIFLCWLGFVVISRQRAYWLLWECSQ